MYFKNLCLYYINLRDLRPSFIQSYIMSGMRRMASIDSSCARAAFTTFAHGIPAFLPDPLAKFRRRAVFRGETLESHVRPRRGAF